MSFAEELRELARQKVAEKNPSRPEWQIKVICDDIEKKCHQAAAQGKFEVEAYINENDRLEVEKFLLSKGLVWQTRPTPTFYPTGTLTLTVTW